MRCAASTTPTRRRPIRRELAADHRAGLVLIGGEAGIGKTALLVRFAAETGARGARVVWGTCWPAEQAPAYWPWTQVLRSLLPDRDDASLAPELAVIVAPPVHAGPQLPAGDDRGVRLRMFDEVRQLLDAEAARRPVVVILDDLQWSD
ncbi:MAG: ATP-binding protein, partial [Actinomycetota bacterium]|nr:ATP-binding protein [Actinomycetota bacterium]